MGIARGLAALLAFAALAACGDMAVRRVSDNDYEEWRHPTKDALAIRGDREDCQRFHGSTSQEVDNCLMAKGWKRNTKKGFSIF